MFGAILKATNSAFQKDMSFCHSISVKKVMKLLAFIFEQPSYIQLRAIMSIEIIETRLVDKKAICIVPQIVWLCRSEFNKFNDWGTFLFLVLDTFSALN